MSFIAFSDDLAVVVLPGICMHILTPFQKRPFALLALYSLESEPVHCDRYRSPGDNYALIFRGRFGNQRQVQDLSIASSRCCDVWFYTRLYSHT